MVCCLLYLNRSLANDSGLDEYMWWCEDMNMEPLLAVWAGKSYGDILSGPELVPYVEDIMNELEVCFHSSSSISSP